MSECSRRMTNSWRPKRMPKQAYSHAHSSLERITTIFSICMSSIVYGNAADAQARFPQAGKGHPIDAEGRVVVDHYGRGVQPPGRPQGRVQVAGEDGRLKGVGQRVGPGDGLVQPVERQDANHRAEDFVGHHAANRPADRRARWGRSTVGAQRAVPPQRNLRPAVRPPRRTHWPRRARPRTRGSAGRPAFRAASDRPPSARAGSARRSASVPAICRAAKTRCTETQTWPA